MAGQLRITFSDIISAGGRVKLVFERACSADELARNPLAATSDIEIDAEPNLIIETPAQEGSIPSDNDASLAAEMQLKLLDTFQKEIFNFHDWNMGIGKDVFDKTKDFGLLALLTEWDVPSRLAIGKKTFPPVPIVISYYLGDYDNPKMKAVLEGDAISYDVDFLYGETFHGTLLKDNEYYRYDGTEKTIQITAVDLIRWLLLNTSVKNGFFHPEDGGFSTKLGGIEGYFYESAIPPVTIAVHQGDNYPEDPDQPYNSTGTLNDHWTNSYALGTALPTPYQYLTIFNCGFEPDTTNRRRGMSWVGFGISVMMKRLYDRALNADYDFEADLCDWKFYCAGIDPTAFQLGHQGKLSGTRSEYPFPQNVMDANGYHPYLGSRLQIHEPANHNVVSKFRILKKETDDEELYLEASMSCDYRSAGTSSDGGLRHDPFEYSLGNLPSAWDVVTKVPSSLGYRSRYSWKKGKPFIQHSTKKRKPPKVFTPAPISMKATPFGKPVDAITCKPHAKFGKFQTARRTVTSPNYTNNPINFTISRDRSKTTELKEPYYDDTTISLAWDKDLDYFEVYPSTVSNEQSAHRTFRPNVKDEEVTYPIVPDAGTPVNPYQCETCFALMGNYPLLVFGGQDAVGDKADEHDGYEFPMETEFIYVPAGSVAERALGDRIQNDFYSSSYPGIILFAGRDATTNGKTITPAAAPAGDNFDFFRGAGSIDVPYGDDGTFKRAYSARSALAIFNTQHHFGRGEQQTIVIPTLDEFENEKGETGYGAIYEGLSIEISGSLFLLTRVRQDSNTGNTECDVEPIPPEIPDIDDEPVRKIFFLNPYQQTDNSWWDMTYEMYWGSDNGRQFWDAPDYHQ